MSAITVGLCVWILSQMFFGQCQSGCYDENGHPKHCMPDFVNAAFELPVEATNTCGEKGETEFCSIETVRQCKTCDAKTEGLSHGTEFLTDFDRRTSWQSETMLEGIQNNVVNLTLNLRKDYEVTYVRLQFQSPRPESFVIYKKTTDNDEWIPWQYFSGSCQTMYNIPPVRFISKADQAICTEDYSDLAPLKGGAVPFSTLAGRPSAFRFEQSPVLQNWVTASSIRISLTKLNTFGDEVFGEAIVLKSYYYAVSDIGVGSRCKCNGHASSCSSKDDETVMCNCEHHTTGQNCDRCEENYVDKPWARATTSTAFECLACNCNNMTDTCYFDEELYTSTGHGGHCIDCSDNTDGPNCERCKVNHFRRSTDNYCTPCSCNPTGSENLQCDDNGKCKCNPGVIGDKCDRCQDNHHDFGQYGCHCEISSDETSPFNCMKCICPGHSQDCASFTGYYYTGNVTSFDSEKLCMKGQQGPQGDQGIKGESGLVGLRGSRGVTGLQGPKGEAGPQGPQGQKGSEGPKGSRGITGTQGTQGVKGEMGAQGPQGMSGETGIKGPPGEKGDIGSKGSHGEQGIKGRPGEKGRRGLSGFPGLDGHKGDAGYPGLDGRSGLPGLDGRPGQDGIPGKLDFEINLRVTNEGSVAIDSSMIEEALKEYLGDLLKHLQSNEG